MCLPLINHIFPFLLSAESLVSNRPHTICNSAANTSAADVTDDDLSAFLAMDVGAFLQMSPYECILCDSVMLNEEEMHAHMSLHSYESL